MRRIVLPIIDWDKVEGKSAVVPVKVVWPELQLTHDEMLQNAIAAMAGQDLPHPDHSFFDVEVQRP